MNGVNQENLNKLQNAVKNIFSIPGFDLSICTENDKQFVVTIPIEQVALLGSILSNISPFTNLITIRFEIQIQTGSISLQLIDEEKLFITSPWTVDEDSSSPDLVEDGQELYNLLDEEFSSPSNFILVNWLVPILCRFENNRAFLQINLNINIEKEGVINQIGTLDGEKILVYLDSEKFFKTVDEYSIKKLDQLFTPNKETSIYIFLGNVDGYANGPAITILGIDYWSSLNQIIENTPTEYVTKIPSSLRFLADECFWDIAITGLTPYHFHIHTNTSKTDIISVFKSKKDLLSVCYLANRANFEDGSLKCHFYGYKHVVIHFPNTSKINNYDDVFNLFVWSYDSNSSDKLNIVRQMVSLQLNQSSSNNFSSLIENAQTILSSAKSNFQYYLRQNVELFFEKRQKLWDYLNDFYNNINKQIYELIVELQNNLYKTIGLIVGIVISYLINPQYIITIIYVASFVYLLYIVYILVLMLPSKYFHIGSKYIEYQRYKKSFQDVLLIEEIEKIEKPLFLRHRIIFLLHFALVNIIYASLGLLAFETTKYFMP